MAKLHTYHVLCPLLDQKSFLGVAKDSDEENVIVTLGRNVANKYRLSDQKQIGGWTSKDHITSTVVFDKELESYVAVFNNNTIKHWKDSATNLEKVKKHKFSSNILKLIPRDGESILMVFSNGNCTSLAYGLDNKEISEGKPVIKNSETLVDIGCYQQNKRDYICFIIRNAHKNYEIVHCPLRDELGDLEKAKMTRVKLEREKNVSVVGKLVSVNETPAVYLLWSDGKMTIYDLQIKLMKTIGTVPWISTSSPVSMAWMGDKHLILFGRNPDQDGAVIVAYNTSLGVGSCRYPMKMYPDDAKLYCFNRKIILESSNHIGMLPYVVETSRSLSSLLGSHEVVQDDATVITNWVTDIKPQYKMCDEAKELLRLGLSERSICSQIIPELLEANNTKKILSVLRDFQDIPESIIVLLLSYGLKVFEPDHIDLTDAEVYNKYDSKEHLSKDESMKITLLDRLFGLPFSDALIIPYLKNSLTLNEALTLMTFLTYKLVHSESLDVDYESKLIDWCTLLMDSFYQQYLMTKDEKVSVVLERTRAIVMDMINNLLVIDATLPLLSKVLQGKEIQENDDDILSYSIDLMEI